MNDSVLPVGGISPPTTTPKPSSRKASTAKTGLPFDAFLREEVQPKQFQEVAPSKEDPKTDICQKISQDNASQPAKDDKLVNAVQCVPAAANVQQNPTPKDTVKTGTECTQSGGGSVVSAPLKIDSGANTNLNIGGDLAGAINDLVTAQAQDSAGKDAASTNSQEPSAKQAAASNPQPAPDQSGKTQFQNQLAGSLDKTSSDFQVTGDSHQTAKANSIPTPQAASSANPGSDFSSQLSVQEAQKPIEDHSVQAATAGSTTTGNLKKDGSEAAAKPDNLPPVSSGLEKTGFTEANKSVEPARLAEARAPQLMSQILDGLETLVKNKNVMMRLQLYPDELGHIELKVVSNSQGLGIYLRADQITTQQLLESQLSLLRQTLATAGLNPAQIDIGQGNANRSLNTRDPRRSASKLFKGASRIGSTNTNELEIPVLGRNSAENGLDYKI